MDDPKSKGSRDKVGSGGPQGIGAPAKGDSSASDVPANELENSATLADLSISPTPPPKSAPKPLTRVPGDATYVDDGRTLPPSYRDSGVYVKDALRVCDVVGGRYEILQLLGEGGMGAVYKAHDREVDRNVALKLIKPELASNPAILARFKQELLTAHQVTHKNAVRIYDIAEADGVKFITMEFVEGSDLRKILHDNGKRPPEQAIEIIRQVCLALDAAHSVGIIHRDLKPQNIMQESKTGRILVMDFGLARSIESEGMTQTGALLGTIEYMSPEQSMGKTLDQRSDIFAVGLIFYELLTGNTPYRADSAMASLLRRNQERAVPVSELDASVPNGLSDIVSKCLERDLIHRYQHVDEILRDLDAFQGNQPLLASIPVGAVPSPKRPVPWMWVGVGSSVAILTLLGGWFLRGGLNSTPASNPSAAAAAAKAPDVSLAILPFHNASTDLSIDWLGPSLAEMLRTDVGQSASLRTVSSDRLHQVLKDLRIPENADFDPDTLKRVAEFSGADTVVSGRYAKFGDQIRIDATLRDLKRNQSHTLSIAASSEKELPATTDGLADLIRKNLAVSSDVVKELKASSYQPSSKSVRALRDYNQGLQLFRDGKNLEAVKMFQAATQEDPQFALAYSRLGEVNTKLGYDTEAGQASRRAVGLSDKLPPQERYLVLAINSQITKDYRKAIEAYENLTKVAPGDFDAQFTLGGLYEDIGAFDKARQLYSAVVKAEAKNAVALLALGRVSGKSGDFQGGLDYLNQALTLTVTLDNDEERAMVLHALGVSYELGLNKPNEALSYYQQSLDIKRRLGQKRGIAESLHAIAGVEDSLGRSQNALKHYQESLQLLREIGDTKGVGDTLFDFSVFYLTRGQNDQGLELAKQALQIERDASDLKYVALCLNAVGGAYFSKGDYDNALIYYQQALEAREKLKIPSETADTLHNLAEVYTTTGQYDEAVRQYLRSLDLRRGANDKRGTALDSNSLGVLFGYEGRYGPALNAKQEALKTFQGLQERSSSLAEILIGYGQAQAEAGLTQEGQKNLEDGLSLARELKSQSLAAQALNNLGDCFLYRGDLKSAEARYREALQAAGASKDPRLQLLSKINLAKVAVWQGRSRESLGALKGLIGQADKAGEKYFSMAASLLLAQALIDFKDYPRARQEVDRAVAKSEKMGLRTLQAQGHYFLGTLLRLTGKAADASTEYQSALRVLEQIRAEPGAEKLLERYDLKTIYTESTRWSKDAAG